MYTLKMTLPKGTRKSVALSRQSIHHVRMREPPNLVKRRNTVSYSDLPSKSLSPARTPIGDYAAFVPEVLSD